MNFFHLLMNFIFFSACRRRSAEIGLKITDKEKEGWVFASKSGILQSCYSHTVIFISVQTISSPLLRPPVFLMLLQSMSISKLSSPLPSPSSSSKISGGLGQ